MSAWYEKSEVVLSDIHKTLPHLPVNGRRWLATNIWWIVLIAAVFGVIGAIIAILLTIVGGVFVAGAVFLFSAKFGGLALLLAVLVVALTVLNVVIAVLAIGPLKAMMRKGWLLLTASLLIGFMVATLSDIIRHDEWAIVKNAVFMVLGIYIMFELREYFTRTDLADLAGVADNSDMPGIDQ